MSKGGKALNRIGVLTSGGDAPGMNAAIRAVVRYGIDAGLEVYGINRGYDGLIDGEIQPMDRRSVGDILQRGGTILRTARSKRFMSSDGIKKAVYSVEMFKLDGLVVIGGDGSMKGAAELAKRDVAVMLIPGTIDNDMPYTDDTIGFDTAVNTVLDAVTRIRDTSASHLRTTVIEVMGRHSGKLAISAGLAGGAEYVLVPEVETDINDVCHKIISGLNAGKQHSIIIKAEGYPMSTTQLVNTLAERTAQDVKPVVLSYLQRGGSPTFRDRMIATACGSKAVELLNAGITGKAIAVNCGSIEGLDIEEAIDRQREFDADMMKAIDVLSK